MGTLFIVATPIGNLQDISLRALDVLKHADLILAEDTRVTRKLLKHFCLTTPLQSYHQHTKDKETQAIVNLLQEGSIIALLTDSGTPGVSDPGNELIEIITNQLCDISIIPIPGASAVSALVSVCGFPTQEFLFRGYLPKKKGRTKALEEIAESKRVVIFFESPYRIIKTLRAIAQLCPKAHLVVGRELTKKFETITRGGVEEVIKKVQNGKIQGEFTVAVWNP